MANFDDIIQEINTNLPDNNSQLITAKKLRDTLVDLTDKIDTVQDDFESTATENYNNFKDEVNEEISNGFGVIDSYTNKAEIILNENSNITKVENAYINYSNHRQIGASVSTNIQLYKFTNNNYKTLRIRAQVGDTIPAIVAFYSSDITTAIDPNNWIAGTQAVVGVNDYTVNVPDGCKTICISNRATNYANPIVYTYSLNAAITTASTKLVFQHIAPASSAAINISWNEIRNFSKGSKFKLVIDEYSNTGSVHPFFSFFNLSNKQEFDVWFDFKTGSEYYFEQKGDIYRIRLYFPATAGSSVVINYSIYQILDNSYIEGPKPFQYDLAFPSNGYVGQEINLGTGKTGAYNLSTGKRGTEGYWVSYPFHYDGGYKINIQCSDWTNYRIQFLTRNIQNGSALIVYNYTADGIADLNLFDCWAIQIRKNDYSAITPSAVEGLITLTITDGVKINTPATAEMVVEANNALSERIDEIGTPTVYTRSIFYDYPCYYHFSANSFLIDGEGRRLIASESLEDIEVAARLGFKFIEANVHQLSDGNFICIHGTSSTFGPEVKSINSSITTAEAQNTLISSVNLDWVKNNLRYDTYYTKTQTQIPTIEEFCEVCRINNIGIFAGTANETAQKKILAIMGDNVIFYQASASVRNYFNGYVYVWNNNTTATPESLIAYADTFGAPYIFGLGPSLITTLKNNNTLTQFVKDAHNKGYLVSYAGVYQTETDAVELNSLGFDVNGSGWAVNPFGGGNYKNIDIYSTNEYTLTNATYSDGTITMPANSTVSYTDNNLIGLGKGLLSIRFNGTIVINFGSRGSTGRTITSDGSTNVIISDYFLNKTCNLYITASSATTVVDFVYKVSKC